MSAPVSTSQILVVDDDPQTREALRDALEDAGFSVAEAPNGKIALARMTTGPAVSLIVMDLEMPIMSGFELISIMRKYSTLASLPVLVVTGNPRSSAALERPVVGFFRKPFQLDLFLQSVRKHARS